MDSHQIVMMYVGCLNKGSFPRMVLVSSVVILYPETMGVMMVREGSSPLASSLS